MQLTLRAWRASILALGFEIRDLYYDSNLLTESATFRGEFFFRDYGVPRPRACTALAWASLCAFGPIQGYVSRRYDSNGLSIRHPFNLCRGRFLIPFLPKIIRDEDTNISLTRQSRSHARDESERIQWGPIFIADSDSGQIIEQYSHGQRIAREWMDPHPTGYLWPYWEGQSQIPPLYAEVGQGWQFGIIQTMAAMPVLLRDPMAGLAANGIIELKHGGRDAPKIRRLLCQFLNPEAARQWAKAYSDSMRLALDDSAVVIDRTLLAEEIQKKETDRAAEAAAPRTKKGLANPIASAFLTSFVASLQATQSDKKKE